MSEEEPLVRACLAEPEENTSRLVYADWLDEQGTDRHAARAEWIRMTCAVPRNQKSLNRRLDGEPSWLKANAHRLWPTLASAAQGRVSLRTLHGSEFRLHSSDTFVFRVPSLFHRKLQSPDAPPAKEMTLVWIEAFRGVTASVRVPFTRYAAIAPLVALDEPACLIETTLPPSATGQLMPRGVYLLRRPAFLRAHLGGVWDHLPDPDIIDPANAAISCDTFSELERIAKTAMTAWARSPRKSEGKAVSA